MYSKIILNKFIEHKNSGRISKPDGIADIYNADETCHVEFSLRVEDQKITNCQFRAQANPYIIAVCSTMADMVAGSDINDLMITPEQVKAELQDDSNIDIDFCFDCLHLAIEDYFESNNKEKKVAKQKKDETPAQPKLQDLLGLLNNQVEETEEQQVEEKAIEEENKDEEIIEQPIEVENNNQNEILSNLGLADDDFIFDDDDMLDFGVDFLAMPKNDKNK